MYGWRARIGLICPTTNTVNETEWHTHLPDGVSLHSGLMELEKVDVEGLNELNEGPEGYKKAAEKLKEKELDVIAYGGTSASMLQSGLGERIEENLENIAGCSGVATSAAVKRAFSSLDLQSIAVATPYIDEVNERVEDYIESEGYHVTCLDGKGIKTPTNIGKQSPKTAYRQAKKVNNPDADGIFISCTDYRTFDIIDSLESDLGKPVVTSNQATLWNSLQAANIDCSDLELGELFSNRG